MPLFYCTVLDYLHIGLKQVITHERVLVGIVEDHPVAGLHGCRITRPGLLPAQFHLEFLQIDDISMLTGYKFAEVYRESVCVIEDECILAGDTLCSGIAFHDRADQTNALCKSTQESLLFLTDNVLDQSLLTSQLRIGVTHHVDKYGNEPAQERFCQSEECVTVAYGLRRIRRMT